MYIPVILGTAREGRKSEKVANFVLREVQQSGVETTLIDVRDFHLEATSNTGTSSQAKKWAKEVKKADAIIIVSPEYNHSYPGELKIFLDQLFDEYFGKLVAFCTVSKGPFAGVRVLEQLNLLAVTLKMRPFSKAVVFPKVGELFDKSGQILDPSYHARIQEFITGLKTTNS